MKRRVSLGERPATVAAAFQTSDRLVYAIISGQKRATHRCAFDAAAKNAIRQAIGDADVAEMRRLYDTGVSLREIGRRFNRPHSTIRKCLEKVVETRVLPVIEAENASTTRSVGPSDWLVPPDAGALDWRVIGGGRYVIAPTGAVWDLHEGKPVPPRPTANGYLVIALESQLGAPVVHWHHRLVASVFLQPSAADAKVVRHLDNDPTNNAVSNLAWATMQDNANDRIAAGTTTRGERARHAKLTEEQVRTIRRLHAGGQTSRAALAAEFGVTYFTIRHITDRITWAHVADEPVPSRERKRRMGAQMRLPL